MRRNWLQLVLVTVAGLAVGCSDDAAQRLVGQRRQDEAAGQREPSDSTVAFEPKTLQTLHLPNVIQVHAKVISGGQPDGGAAFEELQSLGIRTVVSVDGAKPDVETAAKHGLKYVHLPHGYDGIPHSRVKELAKAVRDLDGPIYIHCHHGKHRSPAAASVACVAANLIPSGSALSILRLAGTSENYRGLYESAELARPLEDALLDELQVEFRETVELPPLAEAMVAVERAHDRVAEIAAAGWRTPADHPDLVPAHEALILREHFTELLRTSYVRAQPPAFRRLLSDSEDAAQQLQHRLQQQLTASPAALPAGLQTLADRITSNCQACHAQFRDIPLSEKQPR